jgi:formylglycine-generating enzyme
VPGFEECPVLNTTWEGANTFCDFFGLRLPTEAEWEFAARGGNRSKGTAYSGSDSIQLVGWYDKNSGNRTHPAGTLMQNELGLFDMTGNVWEWCLDWDAPYDSTSQTDPKGPAEGRFRIYRGGCWLSAAIHCTNDFRCTGDGDYHGITHNGFRCARDGEGQGSWFIAINVMIKYF